MTDLPGDPSDIDSLLGQVADEFFDAVARGEQPDVEEFARRYPRIAVHIRELFPGLNLIADTSRSSSERLGQQLGLRLVPTHTHPPC